MTTDRQAELARRREYEASSALVEVSALMRDRRQYLRWQKQVWSLPGAPVVGIVSATEAFYWHQLGALISSLDSQVAAIRDAVTA